MILSIIQNFWTGLISLSLNRLIRQLTLVNYKFSLKIHQIDLCFNKSIKISYTYQVRDSCTINNNVILYDQFFYERFVQNIAKKHSKPPFNDQRKFAISFHYGYLINIQVYTPLWMKINAKIYINTCVEL